MKWSKRLLTGLLAAGMSLALFAGGLETVQAAPKQYPVLLKINEYYVLYTAPKAPYVDSHRRMMIPLRAISELMGAKVSYGAGTRTATIRLGEQIVIFTTGSATLKVNGVARQMDTIPVLEGNSMFIPVRVLADTLGIVSKWDQSDHLYTLTGDTLMQTDIIKLALEDMERGAFAAPPGTIISNDALRPVSYIYDPVKGSFTIKSQNITGNDIPAGAADVAAYLVFKDSVQFPVQKRERPAVGKDGFIGVTVQEQSPYPPLYLLVKGRLLERSGM